MEEVVSDQLSENPAIRLPQIPLEILPYYVLKRAARSSDD
jgi:hypothetical protein